jgi:ribulose-phosphate 3-epimerase
MIEIIPALIPLSFSDFEEKLPLVRGLVRAVHVDISDGFFTPNLTFPFHPEDQTHFKRIKKEEEGLPFWRDFDFEIHLMTRMPERFVSDWLRAGSSRVVVHLETISDFDALKKEVGDLTELDVALKLETPLEKLKPILPKVGAVQLMSINKIGYQSEVFDERVLERISALRQMKSDLTISIDGGVNLENAPSLVEAGADRLVVGSAVFESDNIRETIENLKKSNI